MSNSTTGYVPSDLAVSSLKSNLIVSDKITAGLLNITNIHADVQYANTLVINDITAGTLNADTINTDIANANVLTVANDITTDTLTATTINADTGSIDALTVANTLILQGIEINPLPQFPDASTNPTDSFTIFCATDDTKKMQLLADQITTGNTRTYTVPDYDGVWPSIIKLSTPYSLCCGETTYPGLLLTSSAFYGVECGNNISPSNSFTQCVGVGYQSSRYINGSNNTAVGYQSLKTSGASSSCSSNIAIGTGAMGNIGFSLQNIAIGSSAMLNLDGGSSNIAIGQNAGTNLGNGFDNILVGRSTAVTTGYENVIIGLSANASTYNNCILLGKSATATANSQMVIKGAMSGQATLVGGTIAVSNTSVTATSRVLITVVSPGGTQGFLSVARNAGVGFTINSTSGTETSTVCYLVFEG